MTAAKAPAAKAAASILPSRPMSKMPARSEIEPGEAGEQQRRREAEARAGELEEGLEVHQAALRRKRRKARSTGTRTRFSSAPVKRMTSAWMTTIMSRLIFGISKASSEPPW